MTAIRSPTLRPIQWRNGNVALIDQTRLPHEEVWLVLSDYPSVVAAIREMRVRGAPAIGIAGAYAMALAAREAAHSHPTASSRWLEAAAVDAAPIPASAYARKMRAEFLPGSFSRREVFFVLSRRGHLYG